GASADVARALEAHRQRRFDALQRVLERERDLHLDVGAALPALLLPAASAHATAAEQPAGQVAEVAELAEIERHALPAGAEADTAVRRAVLVVRLALLRVGEDVVGGLQLLEPLLGLLVALVRVRVVLPGELPIRLLDLLRRRALGYAQDLVEVPSGSGRHSTPWNRRSRRAPGAAHGRPAGSPSGRPRSPSPPRPPTAARAATRGRAGRTCRLSRSPRGPASAAPARTTGE